MLYVKFWDQFCLRQSHLCDNRAERRWRWWVRRRLGAQTRAWTPQSLLLLCPPQHRLPLLLLLLPFLPPGKDRIYAELQVGLVRGGGRGGEVPGDKVGKFLTNYSLKKSKNLGRDVGGEEGRSGLVWPRASALSLLRWASWKEIIISDFK